MRRETARGRPLVLASGIMTDVELFDALMRSTELAVLASMNFLAILVAYLVAAYVAGRRIPGAVAVGTSIVYTMFLIPPFSGLVGNLRRAYDLGSVLHSQFPDSPLAGDAVVPFYVSVALFGVPMTASWLGSLYFMHLYMRGKEGADVQRAV